MGLSSQVFFNISMGIYFLCFLGYLIFAASRNRMLGTLSTSLLIIGLLVHSGACRPVVGNASDGLRLCSFVQYV